MPEHHIATAFATESRALGSVLADATASEFGRASRCPPWTVGDLACHVIIGVGRIPQALARPEEEGEPGLVTATGYYRPDARFSADVNADRVEVARNLARQLSGPREVAAALTRVCAEASVLLERAPAGQLVRTRHGDQMLLTDFARTRVVELAVHGLDLATGLNREPWLTNEAAGILEDLMLPAGDAAALRLRLGCDRAGLIARLTGRADLSPVETAALTSAGVVSLALG